MDFSKLLANLADISTTHICDAYENVRLMSADIQPISSREKIWGKAFTVACEGDILPVMKALSTADTGSMIVIDSGNSDKAILGEIFSTAAQKRGISGIIINGYCRDVDAIRQLNFPVYAKGISPKVGTKQKIGKLQGKVYCGGINIFPEDIIFCDDSGIVVLNQQEANNFIPEAIKIKEKENIAIGRIKRGAALTDIFNFDEHYDNILSGKQSQFIWTACE